MTAETHNQLRGRSLSITVMDTIRELSTQGVEVSVWSLGKHLGDKYSLGKNARDQLRGRLRSLIKELEASGHITTEQRWNAKHRVNINIIKLCPSPSAK